MSVENRTTLDSRFVSCATCKYWSGDTDYISPGLVIVDQNKSIKGRCNKLYYPGETLAFASCKDWEQKY